MSFSYAGEIQARLREAASLEKHVLLKKLRDALESLKGRVAGRNKDDVEEAIAMVSFFFWGKKGRYVLKEYLFSYVLKEIHIKLTL